MLRRAASKTAPLLCAVALTLCASSASAQGDAAMSRALVALVTLEGEIDGFAARALEATVSAALKKQPRFLVIAIDSPGGLIESSEEIATNLQKLSDSGVETVAWIRGDALSGGTMVALACDRIVMASGARMGDVVPIQMRQNLAGMTQDIGVIEKFLSPLKASLSQYAERRGYPLELIRAMVDPNHGGVVAIYTSVGERRRISYESQQAFEQLMATEPGAIDAHELVVSDGTPLTLTAEKAARYGFSRANKIDDAKALEAYLTRDGGVASVELFEPAALWWLSVLRLCNNPWVKLMLYMVGGLCALVAFSSPGFAVPEVLAITCLGLAFGSSWFVGLAGSIELMMLLAGFAFIGLEIFVIPGFGITGVLGLLLVVASVVTSVQGFILPTTSAEQAVFTANLFRLAVTTALFVAGVTIILRFVPAERFLGGLLHKDAQQAATAAHIAGTLATPESFIGKVAVVTSPLRPSGEVDFDGQRLDALSDGAPFEVGATVIIVGRRGFSVLVRAAPPSGELPEDGVFDENGAEA